MTNRDQTQHWYGDQEQELPRVYLFGALPEEYDEEPEEQDGTAD